MSTCTRENIAARYVLCFMFFTGFTVVFLLRVNINLAIVGMVGNNMIDNVTNSSTTFEPEKEVSGEFFEWDEFQQSLILGAFFWGYMLSQIPGGRIAEIYGTKPVFGYAVLINGVLSLAVPVCARWHWFCLFVNRVLQGLTQGVLYPALSCAIVRWVPMKERARFASITVQGCSLGPVIAMPLCGWILTTWGWPSVFYVGGALGCAWYLAWFFLVYSTPAEHPRISDKERRYLEENLTTSATTAPFPWKDVTCSLQFWVGAIAHFGSDWGFHTFYTFAPKYMKSALGFKIEESALLSSLPFLCQYLSATLLGILADYLICKRHWPVVRIRKISTIISHWCPGILVLLLTICTDVTLSVVILTAAVTMLGALSTGYYQNPLDIAPNFAGSLTGISNTFGALTGILSTPIAGAALQNFGSPKGWSVIFYVTAGVYAVTSLPFFFLVKSKELPWNTRGIQKLPAELKLLSKNVENEKNIKDI